MNSCIFYQMLYAKYYVFLLALFICYGGCLGVSPRAYKTTATIPVCGIAYTSVFCQSNNEPGRDYNCVPTCRPGFVFNIHKFANDSLCPSKDSLYPQGSNVHMPWLWTDSHCDRCGKGEICDGSPDKQFCPGNLTSSVENSDVDGCRCKIGTLLSDGTCDETCNANEKLFVCDASDTDIGEQHCFTRCESGYWGDASRCDVLWCKACRPGDFCTDDNYHHCPDNMRSPVASDSFSDCKCHSGYFRNDDTCIICPEGSFCNAEVQYTCPEGTTSHIGSRDENDCYCKDDFTGGGSINCLSRNTETHYPCDDGFLDITEGYCQPCMPGKWCEPGGGEKHDCPEGLFSPYASSSEEACICRPEYKSSDCTSVITFTSQLDMTYTRFQDLESDLKLALCSSSVCSEEGVHFSVVAPPVDSRRRLLSSDDIVYTYVDTTVNTAGDLNVAEMVNGITENLPNVHITISNITKYHTKSNSVVVSTTPVATESNNTTIMLVVIISCAIGFLLVVTVTYFCLKDRGPAYRIIDPDTGGSIISGVKISLNDISV
jgi:hypothetical protein